jgi:hypothetical protein
MSYLNNLTKENIENGVFPLKQVLANSLFYPACADDGGIVKDCNTLNASLGIENFIYCDYAFGEEKLIETMNSFNGYSVFATRSLKQIDLTPNGWEMRLPPNLNLVEYNNYKNSYTIPFAKWIVYERDDDKNEEYGPKRFSLLYIGGEGIATYQAIYWSNNETPKALAIIQPGHAFGLNWTNFTEPKGFLNWIVTNNPHNKMPKQIYFGGGGTSDTYRNLNWQNYVFLRNINNYYGNNGNVSVFQLEKKVRPNPFKNPNPGVHPAPKSGFLF